MPKIQSVEMIYFRDP